MSTTAFLKRLEKLKSDPKSLSREQQQLENKIKQQTEAIRARLTPNVVCSLLLDLTRREICSVSNPAEMGISNLAVHARYLRALSASVQFRSFTPTDDPQTEELFRMCDAIWEYVAHREMLEGMIKHPGNHRNPRVMFAGMMSLGDAIQGNLMSDDDANQRVRRLFGPYSSNIIAPALGVEVDEIVHGFTAVRELLRTRMERSLEFARPVVELWQKYRTQTAWPTREEFAHRHPQMRGAFEDFKKSIEIEQSLLVYRIDDLDAQLKGKALQFLEAFSFTPGDANQDFRSLFDENVVQSRPFARLEDGCFILVGGLRCVFAPLHRLSECFSAEKQRQKLLKTRDDSLEIEAVRLLSTVCEPDQKFHSYYLPLGPNGELFERDILIIRGDVAYVIECKAKALRSVSDHRGNVQKIESDVKKSIKEGYDQACSVIRYFRTSSGVIQIYGSDKPGGKAIGEIDPASLRLIVPVVFLDSSFGLVGTNLEPWLTQDNGEGYPWVVDLDSMTAISLLIRSNEQLIDFIEWRRKLHGIVINEDETVFAGFFLRHGPVDVPNGDLRFLAPTYSDLFDREYLRRKGADIPAETIFVGPPNWSKVTQYEDDIRFGFESASVSPSERSLKPIEERFSIDVHDAPGMKVGRNSSCPCGSGKKYKKCCLQK